MNMDRKYTGYSAEQPDCAARQENIRRTDSIAHAEAADASRTDGGEYEAVIGVEIHVELCTKTKMFCSCSTMFGAAPNTHICPVCTGVPGAMPQINAAAVRKAVAAGLALNCTVHKVSAFDRKNYFYPDLPKGYQITQYFHPICTDGYLVIDTPEKKKIGIARIHMEEDAGKLLHGEGGTLVDCNRCGVPLIEIVSEPELSSGEEAAAFFRKMRGILMFAGVTDGKMNEGSLRCDLNISLRKVGSKTLGVRTETKNLNSFQNVRLAAECEIKRQREILSSGGTVVQETRKFSPERMETSAMRQKETAEDYRYYPEPDLLPVCLGEDDIQKIRAALPEAPDKKAERYEKEYGVSRDDAEILTSQPEIAAWFEAAADSCRHKKLCANILIAEILRLLSPGETPSFDALHLGSIADMMGDGIINSAVAKKLVADLQKGDFDPRARVETENLGQINSKEELSLLAVQAAECSPGAVRDFLGGKKSAEKAIVGKAMALSRGRANPALLAAEIGALLEKMKDGAQDI